MNIRKATTKDYDSIWEIFHEVIQKGDTYAFPYHCGKSDLQQLWLAPNMKTFVAENDQKIVGTYYIKPNQMGRGSHIANCGYMVDSEQRGAGIGGLLCEHSIETAREMNFVGIQFNAVVSTNKGAIKLWEKYGFKIVGTVPKGFDHQELGLVDTYIMYLEL